MKTKTHKISLEDFIEWVDAHRQIYASDYSADKQLYCTLNGGFEVDHNKETIWRGVSPREAVAVYNSIN